VRVRLYATGVITSASRREGLRPKQLEGRGSTAGRSTTQERVGHATTTTFGIHNQVRPTLLLSDRST
jgi:hypothetical protein